MALIASPPSSGGAPMSRAMTEGTSVASSTGARSTSARQKTRIYPTRNRPLRLPDALANAAGPNHRQQSHVGGEHLVQGGRELLPSAEEPRRLSRRVPSRPSIRFFLLLSTAPVFISRLPRLVDNQGAPPR